MLEKHKKLLRNYSQNIDTLEQVAGIQNVIECHGKKSAGSNICSKDGFQMRCTCNFCIDYFRFICNSLLHTMQAQSYSR